MSNVVDFLEMVGQDARLRNASQDEMKLALADVQMDADLHAAILAKDHPQLEMLLRGSVTCCAYFANDGQDDEFSLEQCA